MTPFALLGYLVVALVGIAVWWAGLTIYRGVPPQIRAIIEQNYLVVFVFPAWAVISGVLLSGFDALKENIFNVEYEGFKFAGAGGLAVAWVLVTILGWIIIALAWRSRPANPPV